MFGYPRTYVEGDGNDTLNGRAGNDRIDGGTGNDRLFGGDGNDNLVGRTGDDSIYGGVGNDTLNSGGGYDARVATDVLYGGAGNDSLLASSFNSYASGDDGNDILSSSDYGDVILIGGNGNDSLFGYTGENILDSGKLDGGNGNDRLQSLIGGDTLTGGSGRDIFSFYTTEQSTTITDFSVADDVIYTYGVQGGGLTLNAIIKPEQFRLGSSARDSSDRFIYNSGTGALFYDGDGTGSAKQVQFAQLQPDLALTYRDIFVEVLV